MALTQQQLDATKKYKAGEITSDQYKQAYVTNYDPTKDKSFGKNIAYSGTSSPEALRIQEMSQAYQDSIAPKPAVQPVVQPVQMLPQQQLASAQKSQAVIELERARAKALGGLGAEQSAIAPKFEQGRSDTRRLAINQAKDFENFLATKGISASGTAGQGMIQQQGQLLGSIGQSKTAESNANADIERRRSELETDFAFGVQSAEARAREQELERLYQQQNVADTRAYNEGLTAQEIAREDARTTADRTREDFINTIGGIRDYTAQISNVQNDNDPSNDWQIPFLQQAKQDKIINQNLDPLTGKPKPVDNTQQVWDAAYKKWNAGIPLTQQEMQVIGATTSTKPKSVSSGSSGGSKTTITQDRNYQEDRWERLGKADQAIADAWGIPVGTPFSNKPIEADPVKISEYDDYINTYYRTSADGVNSVDKNGIAMYIVGLEKSGKSDEAIELAIKYNISDKTIEEAERILNSRR